MYHLSCFNISLFLIVSKWTFGKSTVSFQSAIIRSNLWNHSAEGATIATHITQEQTEPAAQGLFDLADMDNTDVTVNWFQDQDFFTIVTDYNAVNKIHTSSLRTLGNLEYK